MLGSRSDAADGARVRSIGAVQKDHLGSQIGGLRSVRARGTTDIGRDASAQNFGIPNGPVRCEEVEYASSANTAQAIVEAENLSRRYGEGEAAVNALSDVTVEFPASHFAAIMGPSGSGKSTLMHILAGLDRPTAGTVRLGDVELTALEDKRLTDLRRDRIGFIFQTFNLLPVLNAEENILLPLSIAGRKPDREWFERLVQTVGIGDRLTHRPAELSGGQQQRVAVARALVSRPDVVFADEPTGNLDSKASNDVLALLRDAVDDFDQTVVMVTHDAHAASFADRLLVLADGRIVHDKSSVSSDEALDLMKSIG
jgi:putative ABC transport system ATP-binding protein